MVRVSIFVALGGKALPLWNEFSAVPERGAGGGALVSLPQSRSQVLTKVNKSPSVQTLVSMLLSCSLGIRTLRRVKKVASGEWAQDLLAAWVTMAVAFRTQAGRSYPAQRTPRDAEQPSSRAVA